jgi:hypothetical protein
MDDVLPQRRLEEIVPPEQDLDPSTDGSWKMIGK